MLTKQRGRTRSAGGQNLQELSRAHDLDALIGAELPQLSITRHEVFGRAAQRGAEDFVVRWVRGHAGYWRGYRNWRRKGAYKVQKGRRRARGQAPDEIRLRQRAGELLEDISEMMTSNAPSSHASIIWAGAPTEATAPDASVLVSRTARITRFELLAVRRASPRVLQR